LKVIIDSKERRTFALSLIQGIRQEDCPMEVTIEPYIEKHSDPQRALFHVAVRELSKETGYTEGEVKELVKKEILGTKIVKIGNTEREVTCSSEYDDDGKPRDKPSYSELIEGLYRIAGEAGIRV
jgi:hypothetical protein